MQIMFLGRPDALRWVISNATNKRGLLIDSALMCARSWLIHTAQVGYDVWCLHICTYMPQVYTSESSYELAHRILIPYRGPNPTPDQRGGLPRGQNHVHIFDSNCECNK